MSDWITVLQSHTICAANDWAWQDLHHLVVIRSSRGWLHSTILTSLAPSASATPITWKQKSLDLKLFPTDPLCGLCCYKTRHALLNLLNFISSFRLSLNLSWMMFWALHHPTDTKPHNTPHLQRTKRVRLFNGDQVVGRHKPSQHQEYSSNNFEGCVRCHVWFKWFLLRLMACELSSHIRSPVACRLITPRLCGGFVVWLL
jgi:hypothetical protein